MATRRTRSAREEPVSQRAARRIQLERKRQGRKQQEIAEALNIPTSTYAKWENLAAQISVPDLVAVASELGKSVSYFIGENSEEEEQALILYRLIPADKRRAFLDSLLAMLPVEQIADVQRKVLIPSPVDEEGGVSSGMRRESLSNEQDTGTR